MAPELTGQALAAVKHRGSHMQIIAAAGSGKTEVVSQRVADLLEEDVDPRGIVAFTERAAEELKQRIAQRVEERMGKVALDKLVGLYVGTIHAFCFQLLQRYVPKYETFDVIDENQFTALLSREATRLGIKDLSPGNKQFEAIRLFAASVDVVENELIEPADVPGRFGEVLRDYLEMLDRYRLMTFGQQVVQAVAAFSDTAVAESIRTPLRHLIVDEYQDVNPAQERLIELLVAGDAELCVVGDDQQAIYQWRGSDVRNIVKFEDRYRPVASFSLLTNRRSRPAIISAANAFSKTIPERIEKTMLPDRAPSPYGDCVAIWSGDTALDEAGWIAQMILDLHDDHGVAYRDIAVLVRTSSSYKALVEQFSTFGIPVQPGGRTGLFDAPEAVVLGKTICWLTDSEWRQGFGRGASVDQIDLLAGYKAVFGVEGSRTKALKTFLSNWKAHANQDRPTDLVGNFYELCDVIGVGEWDPDDELANSRLGTLARFTMLLADYESVRRRARPDALAEGEQVGGQDRGTWYHRNLAIHIVNYASGAYEGFDGEPDIDLDAVDLTTTHRAKGLEWPVVFLPAMTDGRFPNSNVGKPGTWLLPTTMFDAARYEGDETDERRLFYVAMTRARDLLLVSRHARVNVQSRRPSPFLTDLAGRTCEPDELTFPEIEPRKAGEDLPISLSFSELSQYLGCGMAYRLRGLIGFQPRLAPELGYGKAVHHMLRSVADFTRASGKAPSVDEVAGMLNSQFFLPTANKPAHRQMKDAARKLIGDYISDFESDLYRVWESERPFELRLDGVTINGRADVILDQEGGVPTALAIVDYKTSTRTESDHDLQLQIYSNAGRREGLDIRGAYVHDLKRVVRTDVPVDPQALSDAEQVVIDAAIMLKARQFPPNPGRSCRSCEVRTVCGSAER